MHLATATSAGRVDEPWPMLFSTDTEMVDRDMARLRLGASMTLDRLVQASRVADAQL
jgi:hypothetical protein